MNGVCLQRSADTRAHIRLCVYIYIYIFTYLFADGYLIQYIYIYTLPVAKSFELHDAICYLHYANRLRHASMDR